MSDDVISIEDENNLFDIPERILIIGTSNSGKTHLAEELVRNFSKRFYRIIICGNKNRILEFPETKDKSEFFSSDRDIIFNPFLEIDKYETKKYPNLQCLVLYDDMMDVIYKSQTFIPKVDT